MLVFQFQYKPLFQVKFEHNFFEDKHLRNYTIKPEVETVRLFDSLGLLMKKTDSGIDILADNCQPEKLIHILETLKKDAPKLRFLMFIDDPLFKNYTNISFNTTQKLFYFSNKHLKDSLSGTLHESEYVSEDNMFDIKEEKYIEVPEKVIIPTYKKGQALGLIEINISEIILDTIIDKLLDAELITYSYAIRFDNRSVFWKYFVIPGYSKKLKGLKIVEQKNKDGVKFSNPEEVTVKDDKSSLVFTSDRSLKLQQYYDYSFQLKRGDNENGGKVIIKKLQFASLEKLKPLKSSKTNEYYSEIYIYI